MFEPLVIALLALVIGFILGAGVRMFWILRDMHSARRDARRGDQS